MATSFLKTKKADIEKSLNELKEAHKAQDVAKIDASMETLNAAWQAASEDIYKQQQQDGGADAQQGQPGGEEEPPKDGGSDDDEVTDVDFEEVKE